MRDDCRCLDEGMRIGDEVPAYDGDDGRLS